MSKIESGVIELEEVPFDLLNLLDEVVSMIEVQAVGRGLEFAYDGRNVTFEFVCADTGKGMSKEFQQQMYDPFSQEMSDARTSYTGTGLGLSIVKRMLDQMGGRIDCVSDSGKGSTFTITLPLALDLSEKPEIEEKVKADIEGLHLLVAEDNELNMEIAEFLLENAGAATRAIRALPRADAKTIPIIAMTANAFAEDRERVLAAGMNEHLAKPLDTALLIETIARLAKK